MPNPSSLRILVTNDDGIHASGLRVLETIARTLTDDVWVVAPETEQSGAGHSLTLHVPLRIRKISEREYAVSGTPTDCTLLAARAILPRRKKIDLVLSGINRGSNLAEDVTYSGTIAAAMEGALLEIPSIAFSQEISEGRPASWKTAETFAPGIIRKLLHAGWRKHSFINVNFPDLAPAKVKGVKLCPQGMRKINEKLEERIDPKGRPYYWIGGPDRRARGERTGCDLDAVKDGYIAVTPLTLDLTDAAQMKKMQEMFKA